MDLDGGGNEDWIKAAGSPDVLLEHQRDEHRDGKATLNAKIRRVFGRFLRFRADADPSVPRGPDDGEEGRLERLYRRDEP